MRDPATEAVTTGDFGPVWSVAVPGRMRGDQVRVELVGTRAWIYVQTTDGSRAVELAVELPVDELRALVRVLSQWPGVVE
jgi:hypothetical protein